MKHGVLNVNEANLYYEIKGDGSPIVFISGGGVMDRRCWDDQFESFARYNKVIRYDIRGLGKSSRPTEQFSHSDDLYALLKSLEITKAHIVGLSAGGAIAIDFTLEHPEMVDRLILAASGLSDDATAEANMKSLSTLASVTKAKGIEFVTQAILEAGFLISKENVVARERIATIYMENRDVFESGFPVYSLWRAALPPASERISEIRAETLIIKGDEDNPAYAALTDKISKGIKGAKTIVIPGGTHFINLEKPDEFNRAVSEFLSSDLTAVTANEK